MLSKADRLKVARITGLAMRLAGDHADDAMGEVLAADLDRGEGEHLTAAIVAVHAISADPVVLNESAAMYTVKPETEQRRIALRLLVAAGADLAEAERIQAARGKGWVTPQADAWRPD